jgi:hypothetical protein
VPVPPEQVDVLHSLVRAAFEQAAASGKPPSMRSAVLKNRLLNLTDGRFAEQTYGAESFKELLEWLGDVLSVDTSTNPPMVSLKGAPDSENAPGRETPSRVPNDLWSAVVDYRSGDTWVWDPARGLAERSQGEVADQSLVLPTLTPDELTEWRRAFAAEHEGWITDDAGDGERLSLWAERGLGTGRLPPVLRAPWNRYQHDAVVKRLDEWFRERKLPLPPLSVPRSESPSTRGEAADLVREIVSHMTEAELRQLAVPVSAIIRWQSSSDR